MFRKGLSLLMVLALIFAMAACGGKTQEPAKTDAVATQETKSEPAKQEAKKEYLIGFANLAETINFCVQVRQSIEKEVKKAGWKLVSVDNNVDGATAVKNADLLITQKVDAMLEFNVDSKVAPTIMEKFNAVKIPVIAIDVPHPGAPFFGADNVEAGKIVGRALAAKAKKEWNGQVDLVVLVDLPGAGETVAKRMDNILVGIKETIAVDDKKVIRVDGKNDVLPAKQVVADTLTANPKATHILIGCLNDQNASGALSAAQSAKREKDVFIASHGCDAPAITNLRGAANAWIGSVAYYPEKYGEYLVPLLDKIFKGEKVPDVSHPEHLFVSKDNIEQVYPAK